MAKHNSALVICFSDLAVLVNTEMIKEKLTTKI